MGDDITIGVTEIVNNIEVTAQPNDQIVDISVIDNADDVTLNITPTVIEINVNKGSSYAKWGTILGTLSDQTDLQNALDLKADLVDGKVPSYQLPSYVDDVIEVANYAALPVVGESGKIYVTIDNNHIFRWTGSTYVEITDNTAVWGAITGTLSSQTDLQNALNTKVPYTGATGNVNLGEYGLTSGYYQFDTTPTGTPTSLGTMYWDAFYRTISLVDGDGDTTLQIGQEQRTLIHNNTGATLTDGQVVYITGSTGELPTVALANSSNEGTSAATLGVVTETILNGAAGFITDSGIVHGLNTLSFNEGDMLWLGTTAGTFTNVKPTSPNHLVLIGYVVKKAGGNGSIKVKIQNTQELDECSDVLFSGLTNNDILTWESATSLWKNKSIATILGYTPANDSNVVHKTGNESIAGWKTFTGGITIWDNTSSNLLDFYVNGTEIGSINVGTSYMQFSALNSGGYLFKNNAGANSLTLTNSGVATFLNSVTATSFIKSGGTSSQFLKADGSVDSSTYASDSLVVKLAGSQTITGSKLFTANTSFQGATIIDYIGGISLKQTGLSLYNQMVAVDGGFNFYENAGTVFSFKIRPEYISFGDSINNAILNASNLTAERTFDLPNASGTIALTSNIPSVSGTTNYIPKFTGASALGNSLIYDDGANVNIGGGIITNKSVGTFWQSKNGATNYFIVGNDSQIAGGSVNDINYYTYTGNQIFSTNGSERMRITSSGNVGIGTTSPTRALHVIGGDGGTGSHIAQFEGRFGAVGMYVRGDGNVGIGTTSPTLGKLVSKNSGYQYIAEPTDTATYGYLGIGHFTNGTFIGTTAGTDTASDLLRFGTNGSERMRITSGGNVLIGTTSGNTADILTAKTTTSGYNPFRAVGVTDGIVVQTTQTSGTSYFNYYIYNGSAVGSITSTGSSTSYNTSSDYRLKQDLKPINGLNLVSQIKVYDYQWKSDETRAYGVLAHELQEVIPQAVNGEKDGEQMQGVDYSKLVPILVQAIQDQQKQINELKTLINK